MAEAPETAAGVTEPEQAERHCLLGDTEYHAGGNTYDLLGKGTHNRETCCLLPISSKHPNELSR
jgi:hypothetical protein